MRMRVLRLHRRICLIRFLKDTSVTTLSTAQTIWKIVVSVNPLKAATATNGMVVASVAKRTIGRKNMEIMSPAAIVRNRLCILKNIIGVFWFWCGKNREKSEILSIFDISLKPIKVY